jgi:proteasome lid subunit RPN8/RPN11
MNSNRLEVPKATWLDLMADLRQRGGGRRESGAFLLGEMQGQTRHVRSWVTYDDLDPDALTKGYVRLGTAAFTKLWTLCEARQHVVVADVHTHPRGPDQSLSDRTNPMVSQSGHMALIVPRYAQGKVTPRSVSVNVYLGAKSWATYLDREAEARISLV